MNQSLFLDPSMLKTIFLLHALIQGKVYYDPDTNKFIEEKNFPTIQIKPNLTKNSDYWTFEDTTNWPDCDKGGKILKIILIWFLCPQNERNYLLSNLYNIVPKSKAIERDQVQYNSHS